MSASVPRPAGPERAALVLLALDEDLAGEVLRHLEEADLRRLAELADGLGPISVEDLAPAFEEFERRLREPLMPRSAGAYLRRLAATAIGEERVQRLLAPAAATPQPIEALRGARTATLAQLLADEHPQVAAVIVSQLPREQAARLVQALPAERQSDLVGRIAALKEIPPRMVELASEALAKALAAQGGIAGGDEQRDFDGIAFAAGLLNELPPTDSERLLASVDQGERKLTQKIREAMFTFEDLRRLGTRALQVLMREVATDQLLVALKTASDELREHFLSAVSSRAAAAMRDDLQAMPPTRLSDVEKAQREIVECAMRLASEGRLVLPGSAAERLV